jgi:hypothetical protein
MTAEPKNRQEVTLSLSLEEWSAIKGALHAAWEKAVKLDEKARKADFAIKEQTAAAATAAGDLLAKIEDVVAK